MRFNLVTLILGAAQVTHVPAASVPLPTASEIVLLDKVARSVTYDDYGEPISDEATGCVQVHCGASHNTVPDFKTYYEITLTHNGQLLFYFIGTSDQRQYDNTLKWSGATDANGKIWGLRMIGDCNKIEYINNMQSNDGFGYYALSQTTYNEIDDEGPCFGESKTGKPRCLKATLWEATFNDNGQCGSFAAPATCDFRGRCVDVNSVPSVRPEGH